MDSVAVLKTVAVLCLMALVLFAMYSYIIPVVVDYIDPYSEYEDKYGIKQHSDFDYFFAWFFSIFGIGSFVAIVAGIVNLLMFIYEQFKDDEYDDDCEHYKTNF